MIFEHNIPFHGRKFGTATLATIYRLNQEYQGQEETLVALTGKFWNHIVIDLMKWHRFGREAEVWSIGFSSNDNLLLAA